MLATDIALDHGCTDKPKCNTEVAADVNQTMSNDISSIPLSQVSLLLLFLLVGC